MMVHNSDMSGDMYIRCIAFTPDGKYLVTGAEDHKIRVRLLNFSLSLKFTISFMITGLGYSQKRTSMYFGWTSRRSLFS